MKITPKLLFFVIILAIFTAAFPASYGKAVELFKKPGFEYYHYTPKNITPINTSSLPPATAVPVLMYHGVVLETDTENTDLPHFIEQMEMLKLEGYQTITFDDYYNFRSGTATLPPKPIIITFDDGRKDSYYTTDDIFRQLGFKATIFEVSGKANDNDKFYLNWDELQAMKDSGRWNIEAHGTYSHTRIPIDESGTQGHFLTSKIYSPSFGLETDDEFKNRIEADYVKNIDDLKSRLGIDARYFAIPLNDYGNIDVSNYPRSVTVNQELINKYFRLAFIEINDNIDVNRFSHYIYNFSNGDPHKIGRIEVKNMSAADLKKHLDLEYPRPPSLELSSSDLKTFKDNIDFEFGSNMTFVTNGLLLEVTPQDDVTRVNFGQPQWQDYTVELSVKEYTSRSVVLLGRVSDNSFVSFGITDNSLFLRQTINNVESQLRSFYLSNRNPKSPNTFKLVFNGQYASAYFNNTPIFIRVPVTPSKGSQGIKVWSDQGNAYALFSDIRVSPGK